MTVLLVSSLVFVSGVIALSLRGIWSQLPDRNLDFDLAAEDLDLEHRS